MNSEKLKKKIKDIKHIVKMNGGNANIAKTLIGIAIISSLGKGELKAQENNNNDENKLKHNVTATLDAQSNFVNNTSASFSALDSLTFPTGTKAIAEAYYGAKGKSELFIRSAGQGKLNGRAGIFNINKSFIEEVSSTKSGVKKHHGASGLGFEIELKLSDDALIRGGAIWARTETGRIMGIKDQSNGDASWYMVAEKKDFYLAGGTTNEGDYGFFCLGGKVINKEKNKLILEGSFINTGNSQLALYANHNFTDRFLIEGIGKLNNEENSFSLLASKILGKNKNFVAFGKANLSSQNIEKKNSLLSFEAGVRLKLKNQFKR